MVETEPPANTGNVLQAMAGGDIDCEGSKLYEGLGGSCADACHKVEPGTPTALTLRRSTSTANNGTCSGTCGLFVCGWHCQATGEELKTAYNGIHSKGRCAHCGRSRLKDGCMIKIDRVTVY
ncbi:hypothetical protein BDV23DRAFT_183355 [Aspergillus alliaceus]|uniref:Uncharacterized protein n=1 Tax=Petromyces alliaceus TaxID=209559 RepID=A0A5N7CAP7_PETAA|nr:hypothetical protein BDV23DRAFT_183355 [Aspergillus alliaceus]